MNIFYRILSVFFVFFLFGQVLFPVISAEQPQLSKKITGNNSIGKNVQSLKKVENLSLNNPGSPTKIQNASDLSKMNETLNKEFKNKIDSSNVTPLQIQNVNVVFTKTAVITDFSKLSQTRDGRFSFAGEKFKTGDILVDSENVKKPLKIVDINSKGELLTTEATFREVIENCEIPDQTIPITADNIIINEPDKVTINTTKSGKNVQFMSTTKLSEEQTVAAVQNGPNSICLDIPDTSYTFTTESGSTIQVRMKGSVGVAQGLDINYGFFSGYKFGIAGGEYLHIDNLQVNAKLQEDAWYPVYGVSAGGKWASARIGVFLHLKVNGDFELVLKVRESVWGGLGVKGDTFLGIPYSCKVYKEYGGYYWGDSNFVGQVDARLGLTPRVDVKIAGFSITDINMEVGARLYAQADASDPDIMWCGMNAYFTSHVEILGFGFSPVNGEWEIFNTARSKRSVVTDSSGKQVSVEKIPIKYEFYLSSLDVERGLFKGYISGNVYAGDFCNHFENDKHWYGDYAKKPIILEYDHNGNKQQIMMETNENGNFEFIASDHGITVEKGDSVIVKAGGDPNSPLAESPRIYSSFQCPRILLNEANWFDGYIEGSITAVQNGITVKKPQWSGSENSASGVYNYHPGSPITISIFDLKGAKTGELTAITDILGEFRVEHIDPALIRDRYKVSAKGNWKGFTAESNSIEASSHISFYNSVIDTPEYIWADSENPNEDKKLVGIIHHMQQDIFMGNGGERIIGDLPEAKYSILVNLKERETPDYAKTGEGIVHSSFITYCWEENKDAQFYYEYKGGVLPGTNKYSYSTTFPLKQGWYKDRSYISGTSIYWSYAEKDVNVSDSVITSGKLDLTSTSKFTQPSSPTMVKQKFPVIGSHLEYPANISTEPLVIIPVPYLNMVFNTSDKSTYKKPVVQFQTKCTVDFEGLKWNALSNSIGDTNEEGCNNGKEIPIRKPIIKREFVVYYPIENHDLGRMLTGITLDPYSTQPFDLGVIQENRFIDSMGQTGIDKKIAVDIPLNKVKTTIKLT